MMEWKEELQQHTKEAEKVVQGYLPELLRVIITICNFSKLSF